MVPLRDNNPTQTTAYITYALIVLNVVIFLFEISLTPPQLNAFLQEWAVVPRELTSSFVNGTPAGEWITLFTSQFLHAGFLHLGGNMLFLWIFGNNVEDKLGHVRFILFYLLCGALAALAQWFFAQQSPIPSLGASGAIAGVMGAYILRFPRAEVLTLLPLGIIITTVRLPAVLFLGFWFIQQAFNGTVSLNVQTDVGMSGGVAYWAHAGGFVFGAVLGPLFGLFSDKTRSDF